MQPGPGQEFAGAGDCRGRRWLGLEIAGYGDGWDWRLWEPEAAGTGGGQAGCSRDRGWPGPGWSGQEVSEGTTGSWDQSQPGLDAAGATGIWSRWHPGQMWPEPGLVGTGGE